MNNRDIVLIAFLAATITVAKLSLSMIANVELVTFLLIIYTLIFGLKKTLWISFIFVTIEIFIWGFGTWILGYYIIWPLLVVLTNALKGLLHNEYQFAIFAGLYGLFFGLFFALYESLYFGIGYGVSYYISGFPFDIVHMVSNFIVMLVLYKPIITTLTKIKEKFTF